MKLCARRWALLLVAASFACAAHVAMGVPPGYRYVGSRVVSEGRVVFWYWNVDHVEIGPFGASFVARLYARAVDVNQERPFAAIVRCDSRTYRGLDSREGFEPIDEGEPIYAVWKAGCAKGLAIDAAHRYAQLGGKDIATDATAVPVAAQTPAPTPPVALAQAPAAAAPPEAADPRRADTCVRMTEARTPAGDASITNTCAFAVEVTLCYKGSTGGAFDCPTPSKGRHGDTLGPGTTHVLPEYRRGRHKGINVVACRGAAGSVFPRLDDAGKSGCF